MATVITIKNDLTLYLFDKLIIIYIYDIYVVLSHGGSIIPNISPFIFTYYLYIWLWLTFLLQMLNFVVLNCFISEGFFQYDFYDVMQEFLHLLYN